MEELARHENGATGGEQTRPAQPREVIVGYDGSERAKDALRAACALASTGSAITVVHAYELPREFQLYWFFEDFERAAREAAQEVLDEARECAAGCHVPVRYELAVGKPAEVLADMARRRRAAMIIVGSRGLGHLRAAVGSVTHRLLHRAPCPVLVVPEREEPEAAAASGRAAGARAPLKDE